ncbi:hypothetical protein GCM10027275_48370 [Rhabdobacter roseus]|uniref:Phospholipid/cholesterol/gamma-HCH transport system substrate-binding protein n=1 Tax=Rhabdobacter roseus TaxID=1655419 RepID=A0A840U479_9BACT|nr:MlaD family protein [Rhabdobacter roseus]MBB5286900.1 phospholipid/cholesterol/gamma-HCH transport system substrate-binding protein [Rhabdobacter roseus]
MKPINPKKRAVTVGLFVFLGLVIFIVGVLTIGSMRKSFVPKVTVRSIFDDVNGLQAGNNVWFSGVKVGTVKRISFYEGSKVEVILNIEEKSQQYIRKDATVKISTDGLIGNKIIVIAGGTPKVPSIEEGDVLKVQTEDSQQDIMNTLQENNKNILAITSDFKEISRKIRAGEGSVGKLLGDESLYNDLNTTMASLKRTSQNAQNLTASLSSYSAKLTREGGLANDLATDTTIMRSVKATMQQLNTTAATAQATVDNLKRMSDDLQVNPNSPVGVLLNDEKTASELKTTVRYLESSSQKLDENLEALQHNFLLRGFFRKRDKREQKAQKESAPTDTTSTEVR